MSNDGEAPARRDEERVRRILEDTLVEHGLTYTRHDGAHGGLAGLIVELPGERKLSTNTLLSIGEHSVRVEAFALAVRGVLEGELRRLRETVDAMEAERERRGGGGAGSKFAAAVVGMNAGSAEDYFHGLQDRIGALLRGRSR